MNFGTLLFAVQMLTNAGTGGALPAGTPLEIRLTSTAGTYASKVGDPISADLIVPVVHNGETLLPAGSKLTGTLRSVQKVGYGILHETGALDFAWNRITLPDGTTLPLSARVDAVDTGRERVTADGSIRGERKTASLAYRTSGYVRTAISWEVEAPLALWAVKMLLVQLPEPELYYPAGVELRLKLNAPLLVPVVAAQDSIPALEEEERERLEPQISELPLRAADPKKKRPSDLMNVMFVGSKNELVAAFAAAGWKEAQPGTLWARVKQIRAVSEGHGFAAAPMSLLQLNDTAPQMSLEKGFNDTSKRHHIRIWKYSDAGEGDEDDTWIAAATRDVDFAYLRPGHALTHKIESNIDNEREKVVNDLAFTQCLDSMDRFERPQIPAASLNATGDRMFTDTQLAVLKLNACNSPRGSSAEASVPLAVHGNRMQRFLRREVLTFRNDMLRENIYWRSYEGARWTVLALHAHWQETHVAKLPVISSEVQLARLHRPSRGHAFGDLLR